MLRLSPDLSLPDSYVTSTGAALAVRGAGKSNLGAVLAEEMAAAKLPFVVVDPVGSWWGLRAEANGKAGGLPVPIFGGAHGDLPIAPNSGAEIVDVIVADRLSCVVDLSRMPSESEKKKFLLAFARRLYEKNEDPLHLFLEEADDYIPQKPMRDELQLLRAFENIVRRGRARGLGITLLTQRSAVVNKNVLTQTETLFALRTTSPQDIAAIEAWVQYHQQDKEIIHSLSSLKPGEAWVWSPHFLGKVVRTQIRQRRTFDSGATPKNLKGTAKRPTATLADIDLLALDTRINEAWRAQLDNDPAELRSRLKESEKGHQRAIDEIARLQKKQPPAIDPQLLGLVDNATNAVDVALRRADDIGTALGDALQSLATFRSAMRAAGLVEAPAPRGLQLVAPAPAPRRAQAADTGERLVSGSEQALLDAIRWLNETVSLDTPLRVQVGLVANQSHNSSAFERKLSALRARGLIDYPGPNRLALTPAGREIAQVPARLTPRELHQTLYARMDRGTGELLRVLVDAHPKALTRAAAGQQCEPPQSAGSSAFERKCSTLRNWGLIDYPSTGQLRASDVLFF